MTAAAATYSTGVIVTVAAAVVVTVALLLLVVKLVAGLFWRPNWSDWNVGCGRQSWTRS